MRLKTLALGVAAASLVSAPVIAQATERAAAPVAGESGLSNSENGTQLIILLLIAAAIIGGITLTDDDEPNSP